MTPLSRRLLLVALSATVGALWFGQAEAIERRDGKTYMVVVGREQVRNLDPSIRYDAKTRLMQQAVYDGLLRYVGSPAKVVPWLAEKWEVSDDGRTYIFHLAKNAKFHNGDPVTAEAVRWTYGRTLKLGKGPAWMLNSVLKVENIKALDDHTVQMTLDRAYAPFISFIPWWFIMNPKEVMAHEVDGDMGKKWLIDHEAGGGPYKIVRYEQGNVYEMLRVKDYWKKFNGPLDGVLYKIIRETATQRAMLMKGEADFALDLAADEFEQVAKAKGIVSSTEPALTAFGLKFNTKGKYTSNINLRKALAYSYDYDAFVKIYNGKATLQTSPFTDGIKGKITVPGMPRKDIAKAKEYLAKTPWAKGGIEIEYGYVDNLEEERQMGLVLIDSLKALNIQVKMVPMTWANLTARGAKAETSPDIVAIFATPVSTDPDAVAIQYHPTSWGRYYGVHFYENPKVTALIEKGRKLTEWKDRAPVYAEIQKLIVDDQPEIFGMMRARRIAYRDWVKGFQYSPVHMTSEIDLFPLYLGK
jgi:peptide/nickel transport system substrate-binding protein